MGSLFQFVVLDFELRNLLTFKRDTLADSYAVLYQHLVQALSYKMSHKPLGILHGIMIKLE